MISAVQIYLSGVILIKVVGLTSIKNSSEKQTLLMPLVINKLVTYFYLINFHHYKIKICFNA